MAERERQILDVRTLPEWEQWLETNHRSEAEIWLRLFKKGASESGISYAEAVEVALCFGWIDSMARRLDDISRIQRFSPRRSRSPWSASNVERVQRLIAEGRMRPAGQREVDAAMSDGRWP